MKFIPTKLFNTCPYIQDWEDVNPDGEDWASDEYWLKEVTNIIQFTPEIIMVIWKEIDEAGYPIANLYTGTLILEEAR